jgi:hypothetical protein
MMLAGHSGVRLARSGLPTAKVPARGERRVERAGGKEVFRGVRKDLDREVRREPG